MPNTHVTIDLVDEDGIFGWAVDQDTKSQVKLLFGIDGHILKEVPCNIYRDDLVTIGSGGRLGFHIPFRRDFLNVVPLGTSGTIYSGDGKPIKEVVIPGRSTADRFYTTSCEGEPLSLNKDGYLTTKFGDMRLENRLLHLVFLKGVIDSLEKLKVPTFISYGTLLGCIRNGQLIPHDDDIDVGVFLGSLEDKHEVDRRTVDLCYRLEREGYEVNRWSIGHFQVLKGNLHLDIFVSWEEQDRFFMNFAINGQLSVNDIFPLSNRNLGGVYVPVPCKPELVCQTLYGPNWRVPDTGFEWHRSEINAPTDRDLNETIEYWNSFYSLSKDPVLKIPSQFAAFACNEMLYDRDMRRVIIDIGCGSARDAGLLAYCGKYIGIDGSDAVLEENRKNNSSLEFIKCNFNDSKQCLDTANLLTAKLQHSETTVIYSRFFLHAIDDDAENRFFDFCQEVNKYNPIQLYLEYRTIDDEIRDKATPSHFRRYLDHNAFISKLKQRGYEISYEVFGRGMAKYLQDDAMVGRVIAGRKLDKHS